MSSVYSPSDILNNDRLKKNFLKSFFNIFFGKKELFKASFILIFDMI